MYDLQFLISLFTREVCGYNLKLSILDLFGAVAVGLENGQDFIP